MIEARLLYERLGVLYYFRSEPIHFVYASLRSLNLGEVAGPSPDLARAYATICIAVVQTAPIRSLARLYGRMAFEMAESQDDLSALAWVLEFDGIRNMAIGRWNDAINSSKRAADINMRIGRLRWWEEALSVLSLALNLKGDFAQSAKTWREIYASAHERGDKQVQLWSLCGQATTGLRRGEDGHANAALGFLKKASGLLAEYEYARGPDEIRVYGLLAHAYLRSGEAALALQAAESAVEVINAIMLPSTFYSYEGYVGPPLVYQSLWEAQVNGLHDTAKEESLRELAQKACKGLRRYAWVFPFAQPRSWLFQGKHA